MASSPGSQDPVIREAQIIANKTNLAAANGDRDALAEGLQQLSEMCGPNVPIPKPNV